MPSKKDVPFKKEPYAPVPFDRVDAAALQALVQGRAEPEQQKHAMEFIINIVAATYDMPYRPGGEEGRRDTDFATGKAYVGQQLVKILKTPLSTLQTKETKEKDHA